MNEEPTEAGYHRIDIEGASSKDVYKLLSGAIVPRPIAWISSLSETGKVNLAPFSCFTFISTVPPLVAISCGRKAGHSKDTVINAVSGGDFVLNVPSESLLKLVHLSSAEYGSDESEAEALGIKTTSSFKVRSPCVKDARVSFECKTEQVLEFGDLRTQLLIGRVLAARVADLCYEKGRIPAEKLQPICRLGGPFYAQLGAIHYMEPVAEYFQDPRPGSP